MPAFPVDLKKDILIWGRVIWYNYVTSSLAGNLPDGGRVEILKWGCNPAKCGSTSSDLLFFYSGCDAGTTQSRVYSVLH